MSSASRWRVPLPDLSENRRHTDIPIKSGRDDEIFWFVAITRVSRSFSVGHQRCNRRYRSGYHSIRGGRQRPVVRPVHLKARGRCRPLARLHRITRPASRVAASNAILAAAVQVPGGSNIVLSLADHRDFQIRVPRRSSSISHRLDAVFTNGTYLMTIGAPWTTGRPPRRWISRATPIPIRHKS